MLIFFIFLFNDPSHFAICYSLIDVNSPGVHNLVVTTEHLVQIKVPESYQAFIFSNIDMGIYNAFSLDGVILQMRYRNLFGIVFNGSSIIHIRYPYDSKQNMAVFIIPDQNCNQHSFYAMSKNIFKIEIESKKFDYNLQICGFSPSFVTNTNRKVSIGYENTLNANAQIFYGFESTSQKNSLKNFSIEKTVEKLDKQIKSRINRISTKRNIFNRNHFSKLKKDYDEKSIKTHQPTFSLNRPNIRLNVISPGFLFSHSIGSEIQTFVDINTTYYVSYRLNQTNVAAKMIFDRDFQAKSDDTKADGSMLQSHFDFLLYYDKYESKFIYDNQWSKSVDIDYRPNFWEILKWAWIGIILFFIIVVIIVITCLICQLRRKRCLCLKRRNNDSNNESETSQLRIIDDVNQNNHENEFETICYAPDLDEFGYDNENNYKKTQSLKNNSDSDEFNTNKNQINSNGKLKKKEVNRPISPYQIDDVSYDEKNNDADDNIDELPNPYGLPYFLKNKNYSDNDDSSNS